MTEPVPRFFETAAAFRDWLDTHAATAAELLVGFRKVGTGLPSMTWPASVDEALCVGWIDGVRRRVDDQTYTIRFSPRRPTSIWSAVNIARFEQLRAAGRTTPAGESAFAHRRADRSRVYAYEQPETSTLSADELRQFQRRRGAWRYFEATPPGYRKQMLHRVTSAKRPETRAARLARLIEACAAGVRME